MRETAWLGVLILGVFCAGCLAVGPSEGERTQVPLQATRAPAPTPSPPVMAPTKRPEVLPTGTREGGGAEPEPCELVAEDAVTIYVRPALSAAVFGTLEAGFRVAVVGRTADGWLGFDPAVAQAANVGVFRLRWVREDGAVRLEGGCDSVEEVVGPPPGVCFTMPMDEVRVYASADTEAEVIATLLNGDYAAVLGKHDDWAQVDLSVGNTGLEITGWIPASTLNLNGPCEDVLGSEP